MSKERLKYMTLEEFCEKNPLLTENEKEIYDKFCKRDWIDVAKAYFYSCKEGEYMTYLENNLDWRAAMFKNNERMTKEQEEKWEKLLKMGWIDVADAYFKACEEENSSEEYNIRAKYGWFEGVGMDLDDDF